MDQEALSALITSAATDSEGDKKQDDILADLRAEIQEVPTIEGRLCFCIGALRNTLAQSGTPQFKQFWEIRNLCASLFKEISNPLLRAHLWDQYTTLCREARNLKDFLDEQSAFAAEQFETAIAAQEKELLHDNAEALKYPEFQWEIFSVILESKKEQYHQLQRELAYLNVHASRINSLRKDLIHTNMRIKYKNQFFRRLSILGDAIFPKRKELSKTLSLLFAGDVQAFVEEYFSQETLNVPFYQLREEIKALQGMAKQLTLTTSSFTTTRAQLSKCWDVVKANEQDYKRDQQQKRETSKDSLKKIEEALGVFKSHFELGEWNVDQAYKELESIQALAIGADLGIREKKIARDMLSEVRRLVIDRQRQEERQHAEQQKEQQQAMRTAALAFIARVREIMAQMQTLLKSSTSLAEESTSLIEKAEVLLQEGPQLQVPKFEKREVDAVLRALKDLLKDLKEHVMLLSAPSEFGQLKEMLQQKQMRRTEIKTQLEEYRRAAGRSGLSVDQAMDFMQMISTEKERLERINAAIQDLEAKLALL
jgi:hypothetical protein